MYIYVILPYNIKPVNLILLKLIYLSNSTHAITYNLNFKAPCVYNYVILDRNTAK